MDFVVSIPKHGLSHKAGHIKFQQSFRKNWMNHFGQVSLFKMVRTLARKISCQFVAQFLETPCTKSQVLSLESLIQYRQNYRDRKLHMENKFYPGLKAYFI